MLNLFSGSGRVTFNNQRSYLKAVCAAFVEIKTPKFTKKVGSRFIQGIKTDSDTSVVVSRVFLPPPPRSRSTRTWRTPCVKFAFANPGLSSAETRSVGAWPLLPWRQWDVMVFGPPIGQEVSSASYRSPSSPHNANLYTRGKMKDLVSLKCSEFAPVSLKSTYKK